MGGQHGENAVYEQKSSPFFGSEHDGGGHYCCHSNSGQKRPETRATSSNRALAPAGRASVKTGGDDA